MWRTKTISESEILLDREIDVNTQARRYLAGCKSMPLVVLGTSVYQSIAPGYWSLTPNRFDVIATDMPISRYVIYRVQFGCTTLSNANSITLACLRSRQRNLYDCTCVNLNVLLRVCVSIERQSKIHMPLDSIEFLAKMKQKKIWRFRNVIAFVDTSNRFIGRARLRCDEIVYCVWVLVVCSYDKRLHGNGDYYLFFFSSYVWLLCFICARYK